MSYDILNHIKDTQFLKETEWEFLHKPRRYNYTLIGTVEVDDEEVYIIEFEPKRKGLYIGEMYVSTETFALIKADYEYAEGKSGIDISLLKFIYKKEQSKISIAFEKINGNYELKYFSEKTIFSIGAKRKLALQKKRNRFLIDKKLRELKIKLNMLIKRESSVEFFVINREEITDSEYDNFKQEKYVDIIRIDEFDDNIWGNHPTIEPTKRMKEYKKIKI